MKEYNTKEERIATVRSLWIEWLASFGSITLCVAATIFISPVWNAVLTAALAWCMYTYAETAKRRRKTGCLRLVMLTSTALFWSAIIMACINLFFHSQWLDKIVDPSNINGTIPFIPSLIIFPTVAIVCTYGYINHGKSHFCRSCKETHGYKPEEGFVGNFFHYETRHQLKLIILFAVLISIIDWLYYYYFYNNVNLNFPDKFFFVVLPAVVCVLSLVYVGNHYYFIILDIRSRGEDFTQNASNKVVRFLIIRDDKLLLDMCEHDLLDTPAETHLNIEGPLSIETARHTFSRLAGIDEDLFEVRELYHNRALTYHSTIYHILVTMPGLEDNPLPEGWKLKGHWATLPTIDRFMRTGVLAPALGAEIHRIYTIAMAWKKYDSNGRRLYPIKNYHPTFRLRDIASWDVDFNDTSWFDVASNNQDRRLWKIRRLWRRSSRLGTSSDQ